MKQLWQTLILAAALAAITGCTSTTSTTHRQTTRELEAIPNTVVMEDPENGTVQTRTVREKSSEYVVE